MATNVRGFARAIIPPEAVLVLPSKCIRCRGPQRPGAKVYGWVGGQAVLCRECGKTHRDSYEFIDGEDWEATPDA